MESRGRRRGGELTQNPYNSVYPLQGNRCILCHYQGLKVNRHIAINRRHAAHTHMTVEFMSIDVHRSHACIYLS